MDLVFKRYSSPFLFLDNLILQNKLCDGIDTIYNQVNEDKCWELYLSIPIKEKSFDDWKNEIQGGKQKVPQKQEQKYDFEVAKNKAKNILKNYKPY